MYQVGVYLYILKCFADPSRKLWYNSPGQASDGIPFTMDNRWENVGPQRCNELFSHIVDLGQIRTWAWSPNTKPRDHSVYSTCQWLNWHLQESEPVSSRTTFIIIIANYCEGISYYLPNAGLQTFHSLTHLILIKPDEVDVVIMPILHRGKLKNGEVNDVLPRNPLVLSKWPKT